jgi:hypothetical protein
MMVKLTHVPVLYFCIVARLLSSYAEIINVCGLPRSMWTQVEDSSIDVLPASATPLVERMLRAPPNKGPAGAGQGIKGSTKVE